MAKIISLRLKPLLASLILPNHGAFVEGRWIANNTVLAHELIHKVRKFKGKGGLMLAKIDLRKAYDRLEWSFINLVLRAWGFSDNFRKMIFGCVSSVQYTLLVNSSIVGKVTPAKGLRQGDPLSPYLFIMCTEVLSQLLNNNKNVQGIKLDKTAPAINHLLYADDLVLM